MFQMITYWYGANPTSSVFSINTSENLNENTYDYTAYCFAEKKATQNLEATQEIEMQMDTFIYTGFKPAWLMIKKVQLQHEEWYMYDNKRTPFNEIAKGLAANLSGAEFDTGATIDFLSNGFKNYRY